MNNVFRFAITLVFIASTTSNVSLMCMDNEEKHEEQYSKLISPVPEYDSPLDLQHIKTTFVTLFADAANAGTDEEFKTFFDALESYAEHAASQKEYHGNRWGYRQLFDINNLYIDNMEYGEHVTIPLLHAAIRVNRPWLVNLMFNMFANPNITDSKGRNALHYIAMFDKTGAMLQLMLHYCRYDVHIPTEKTALDQDLRSSLLYLVFKIKADYAKEKISSLSFIAQLLELGADPFALDDDGNYAFAFLEDNHNKNKMLSIIARNIAQSPKGKGRSLLFILKNFGNLSLIKVARENKIYGNNLFILATHQVLQIHPNDKNASVLYNFIKLLCTLNVNPFAGGIEALLHDFNHEVLRPDSILNRAARQILHYHAGSEEAQILQNLIVDLLKLGANPLVADADGNTMLHIVAQSCNKLLFQNILKYANRKGYTRSDIFNTIKFELNAADETPEVIAQQCNNQFMIAMIAQNDGSRYDQATSQENSVYADMEKLVENVANLLLEDEAPEEKGMNTAEKRQS